MPAYANKDLVRTYLEQAWGHENSRLAANMLSPDYRLVVLGTGSGMVATGQLGRRGVVQSMEQYRQAFPDLRIRVDLLVAEDDWVVAQWSARGTHTGEVRGIPPTGKEVTYTGVSLYRIEGEKIAEERYLGDRLGLWQQLGVVPGSHQLAEEASG